ncbi:MAG: DNA integrity scanning diadenylate cyclase DisA, partial [Cutibacterium granulosum]|nr:DNA integrity scanning diadenylate cyclase DisA [Cutibacterium granulosum]
MAILAPGMPIRAGLERIVRGHTGALIVLGDSEKVWEVASGGFVLDAQLTPQALRELCKMDGGLILSEDLERIKAAGVHFVPDGDLPTMETGTRHRSADQVSQQTGVPVVVVSASMSTMAIFLEGERHPIMEPNQLLAQANQALDTLASYRERLSVAAMNLSILEVRDSVAVDDVVQVGRRIEMFRRIDSEVRNYVSGLGV